MNGFSLPWRRTVALAALVATALLLFVLPATAYHTEHTFHTNHYHQHGDHLDYYQFWSHTTTCSPPVHKMTWVNHAHLTTYSKNFPVSIC